MKIISKVEKDNKEAYEALYKGEWECVTEFVRGQEWFKLHRIITDSQTFSAEFLNGFLEEERNNRIEKFYNKEEI